MRRSTLLLPAFALLAAAAFAGPSATAASDARAQLGGTQCKAGERVVYSCAMGRKVVSVCVTAGRMVTYRYGPLGKPEMTVASTGQDGKAHRNEVMLSGGGNQQHLRFTNGGYEYVVYSGITGPGFDPANVRSSGLAVLKGEDEVSSKQCSRNGVLQRISYDDTQFIAEDPDETYENEY
jgi:hypothetical protein